MTDNDWIEVFMTQDERELNIVFNQHCGEGHFEEVKEMLNDPKIRPDFQYSWGFCLAADSGYIDIVKLLLEDGRIVSDPEHYAFINSYRNGHYEITKLIYEWYCRNEQSMLDIIKYIKHTKSLKVDYKKIMRVVQ